MYKPTSLEKWISDRYVQKGILYPWELRPSQIAGAFDIDFDIHFCPAYSGEFYGQPFIVLDKRASYEVQNEQFFHELCHILRHAGNQYNGMYELFRELQEMDARLFTVYAMIPYHMLDFSIENTVQSIMERFSAPFHIAQKRVKIIRERLKTERPSKPKKSYALDPFNPKKYSKETQRVLKKLMDQVRYKHEYHSFS
jgi:Zn-dependent peptidase ImmA (M78 family)